MTHPNPPSPALRRLGCRWPGAFAAGILVLTACRMPRQTLPRLNGTTQTLAATEEAGGSAVYSLSTSGQTATLVVRHQREVTRGYAGFEVTDLSEEEARTLGVSPFAGPIVVRVQSDSPAARGGLLPGDIILAIDAAPADSARHLRQRLAAWRPEAGDLTLRVRRNTVSPDEAIEIRISPEPRSEREEQREEILLDDVAASPADAGLVLATIPASAATIVYGRAEAQVVIADVFLGSPAWRAGLRSGDRIDAVETRPYESAQQLARDIQDWRSSGDKDAIQIRVTGPSGPWTTRLDLDDTAERHRFVAPPLIDVETARQRTEWNVLLVLLNYRSRPIPSPDRETRVRSKLSFLLDAFAIERGAEGLGLTFLWFIHI